MGPGLTNTVGSAGTASTCMAKAAKCTAGADRPLAVGARLRDEFVVCAGILHDDWDEERRQPIDRFTPQAVAEDVATDLDLIDTRYLDLVEIGDNPRSRLEPVAEAIARNRSRQGSRLGAKRLDRRAN